MIEKFDNVTLIEDLKGTQFLKEDEGRVVSIYPDNKVYEVEFFDVDGITLGIETVLSFQIVSSSEYWLNKTPQERLRHLEELRNKYIIKHFNGIKPKFQRVYNVIKLKDDMGSLPISK